MNKSSTTTNNSASKPVFQRGNILAISIAHFVHDVYSGFLSPILPIIIKNLQISYTAASLLAIAQSLPSLLNPVIGWLAEKTSLRIFIVISPAITAMAMSLLGLTDNYFSLLVILLIAGVSGAFFHVPAPVYIKRIAHGSTGRGMSFYMLGGELSRTVAPLVILSAISYWGLEGTWRLMPVGIIASGFLFFKIRKLPHKEIQAKKQSTASPMVVFKTHRRIILSAGFFNLFRGFIKTGFTTFLPIYLISQGATIWSAGLTLALVQLAGALGTYVAGTLSDLVGRRIVLIVTMLTAVITGAVVMMMKQQPSIILLMIIGFAIFATSPVMMACINEIKSEKLAFLNGLYMTVSFMMSAAAVALFGLASDKFGLEIAYWLAIGLSIFSIPAIVVLTPKEK
ncbi:MAG: MFS transporter [Victivallaceae bacterium]|nr:MFS transporter [Victivallaceae bacterium]